MPCLGLDLKMTMSLDFFLITVPSVISSYTHSFCVAYTSGINAVTSPDAYAIMLSVNGLFAQKFPSLFEYISCEISKIQNFVIFNKKRILMSTYNFTQNKYHLY